MMPVMYKMRSVTVVLPASMWAMIPMLRCIVSGSFFVEAFVVVAVMTGLSGKGFGWAECVGGRPSYKEAHPIGS